MIINSPSNPTGAVWDNQTVTRILEYAEDQDWVVISDECYERLVYDTRFVSAEKLNPGGATVLTVQSLSKTYAMTGWRVGYAAGHPDIIKAMTKIQGQMTSCPNAIGQMAAIEALLGDQGAVQEAVALFRDRRNAWWTPSMRCPAYRAPGPAAPFMCSPM